MSFAEKCAGGLGSLHVLPRGPISLGSLATFQLGHSDCLRLDPAVLCLTRRPQPLWEHAEALQRFSNHRCRAITRWWKVGEPGPGVTCQREQGWKTGVVGSTHLLWTALASHSAFVTQFPHL